MRKALLAFGLVFLAASAQAASDALACLYPSYPDAQSRRIVLTQKDDFDQIQQNDPKITIAYFQTLQRCTGTSVCQRGQICDTRALWRRVQAKTVTNDDFIKHFGNWYVDYWGSSGNPSEQQQVITAQIDLASKGWAFKRTRTLPKA